MASNVDPKKERTYIMVKPDGVDRGLVGEILTRFEKRGYKLVAAKLVRLTKGDPENRLDKHYAEHVNKGFYPKMKEHMESGPVFCMVFEGLNAVKTGRAMLGATNPIDSAAGSIRGDYALAVGRNICHGSDSLESAQREIALWFPEGIVEYELSAVSKIYE